MLKARILVVEDERVVALALEKCLTQLGHEVVALVTSGQEAVKKSEALQPDLVLMDIRLKGDMDGIEAAIRIHNTFNTPILYLTAYSDDSTLERAREANPYGYILKPFEEKALKSAIEVALYTASVNSRTRRTRDRMVRILGDLSEGVIVTDVKGSITFVNTQAAKLLGSQADEAAGKFFGEVFHLADKARGGITILPISRVLMEGEVVSLPESLLYAAAGVMLHVDVNLAPAKTAAGNIEGMVLTFHEIAVPKGSAQS
jgi:two-component system cell cycle sensor histidine kinase/response regulator CckA